MPRVDGPFKVLEMMNENAYKIDLPGNYQVSTTFNVRDLTPYLEDIEKLDLRANPIQPGDNDVNGKKCKGKGCLRACKFWANYSFLG